MEPRFRRTQKAVPFSNRGLPGMPVDMEDSDDEEISGRGRYDGPRQPWWRPSGTWSRVLLSVAGVLLLAGAAVALHLVRHFFDHDSQFRIESSGNIQATGLGEVSRADLLPLFGADIGRNIFFVPLNERRNQLEQIPWVERASVMRLLPDQIRVSIVERQPVAFVRRGQQIGLVDANGVLLDMPAAAMAQHHYSFPVLTGIDARDPLPSRKARMAVYLRLMGDLDANGQHNSDQISEIDLTDPEDARVLMPEQGADILAHFGEDHFLERYQRYKAHIAGWRQQYPKRAEVDLRYDQQVILQMTPAAPGDQAAATAPESKPAQPEPRPGVKQGAKQAPAPVKRASAAVKPVKPNVAKPMVSSSHPAGTKTAKGRLSQADIEKAAARQRAARAKARKRAEAKHAPLHKTRQTTNSPRAAAAARQGQ